ncbi:MAG: hypothetical protein AB199_00270 [Parcubacteria bacterium C7867-004]|nr:MAG: hypothetical protein AB199_00270 [Parcubacteria bacterium C7867-004]
MALELTNLLPAERGRALRKLYFLRLMTVGVLVLAGVVIIHGVFLLPSYLYLGGQVRERQELVDTLSASLAGDEEKQVSARVLALAKDTKYLAKLETTPAASSVIAAILRVPHLGITLSGFTYTPAKDKAEARMTLTGMATTREALRSYEAALAREPYVSATDLPISAYAKESDISFTITLTGSLMP